MYIFSLVRGQCFTLGFKYTYTTMFSWHVLLARVKSVVQLEYKIAKGNNKLNAHFLKWRKYYKGGKRLMLLGSCIKLGSYC